MVLIDTNVLVYALNEDAPRHGACRRVVSAAEARLLPGVLVPQVLMDFYAVVTSKRRVERPLAPEAAWEEVCRLATRLPVLRCGVEVVDRMGSWIHAERPVGQAVFDGFLAAQASANGVSTICTCDAGFLRGLTGMSMRTPEDLVAEMRLDPRSHGAEDGHGAASAGRGAPGASGASGDGPAEPEEGRPGGRT